MRWQYHCKHARLVYSMLWQYTVSTSLVAALWIISLCWPAWDLPDWQYAESDDIELPNIPKLIMFASKIPCNLLAAL